MLCESGSETEPDPVRSLTSREGLREHLGGEGRLGARARRAALLVLAQHVPPAAVQEAVQDVGGDDVREGQRGLRPEGRLQGQGGPGGQNRAHGSGAERGRGGAGGSG